MMRTRATLLLLPFLLVVAACGSEGTSGPVIPPPEEGYAFTYTPPAGAPAIQSMTVRGTFNDWGQTAMTLQSNGTWRVVIPLATGSYQYKFFINGQWPQDMCYDETWGAAEHDYWIDPTAEGCEDDGNGGQNAVLLIGQVAGIGFTHAAELPVYVSEAGGRLSLRFRAQAGRVLGASVVANNQTYPMHLQLRHGSQETWRVSVPVAVTSYRFTVMSSSGAEDFGPFSVPAERFRAVPWVGSSIGYQVFPERFWNGETANDTFTTTTDAWNFLDPDFRGMPPVLTDEWNGPILDNHCCGQYFGGDLQGVESRLSHLESLGVSLIYFNPLFAAGSAHGYDAFDHMQVAPEFGGEPALSALLTAARGRGMRLMWDFVPNHVGVGHFAFQDAVQNGPASPYWNWFYFKVPASQVEVGNPAHYDGWWGNGTLPELNTSNSAVMTYLLDVTRHWADFGFDGIRVDVVESIRNPQQFFPAFRLAARDANPDVYLVGEVWTRSPQWLQGDMFDSLMNYALGLDVIRRVVTGALTGAAAAREMALLYAEYPEASTAMQFNIISSHDTSRLLTLLGGGSLNGTPSAIALARQRLASAMLYALPGVPVTFQGDECAFLGSQSNHDEHRYPVQWQACDPGVLAHYQQLGNLKEDVAALHSPVIRQPTGEGSVLSFARGEPGAGELLAIFNTGAQSASYALPSGSWADLVSGETLSGSAPLAAYGWRYLELR
jgi:glycosidase